MKGKSYLSLRYRVLLQTPDWFSLFLGWLDLSLPVRQTALPIVTTIVLGRPLQLISQSGEICCYYKIRIIKKLGIQH